MAIRISAYKDSSQGAQELGRRCGILLATPQQIRKYNVFTHVINWGCAEGKVDGDYLNPPEAVQRTCNKLEAYMYMLDAGVMIPTFTVDREVAQTWWDDGYIVICRTMLRASRGRGMVLASQAAGVPLVNAELYTMYVKKADEYRIHCMRGEIIDVQQKRRRRGHEDTNYKVRSYNNGWVFCHEDVHAPECVGDNALRAVNSLGLDFGAVDVGYNNYAAEPTVYEVNSAPGIEGQTLDNYYEALLNIYPEIRGGAYQRRRRSNLLE